MRLSHYHDYPVYFDHSRVYDRPPHCRGFGKPDGFWVSVDGEDDWAEWCLREEFWIDGLACRHEVVLVPEAQVLHIDSAEGIDAFHDRYAYEDELSQHMRHWPVTRRDAPRFSRDNFAYRQWQIDWAKVATEYDGLIIAPYQWSRRMGGPMWYYGFDCASGVIWDTRAIASVTYKPFPALEAA